MSKTYLQFAVLVLLAMLGFLQYRLWFQKNGLRDMLILKEQFNVQIAENKKLQQENAVLAAQIKLLQLNTDAAAEARARNELGMIKKGETFYQIVK